MTSAANHCQRVLAGIIPDRRDLLDVALRQLTLDHFPDRTLAGLFGLLEHYAQRTNAILPKAALADYVRAYRLEAGQAALYEETYDLLAAMRVDEAAFRWSIEQVRELAAERATIDALTQAMEILRRGVTDAKGETLRGQQAARAHLLRRMAEIDRNLAMQDAPEGDMRGEGDDIVGDYLRREHARAAGANLGVDFGIPVLDEKLSGLQRGELVLLVGYTSEGKTSLVVQLAWHAAVRQGRNVVVLTTETVRAQVRRRVVARHSCLTAFGIPDGLNSRDLKNGTLRPEDKPVLARVIDDFTRNPGYGHCYIVQVPRGATIGYLESKLVRIQRIFDIDLVIMDYLALLRPERHRPTDREELGSILKEAKQLATTFNDGQGVPFVSPWQVSRAARQEAERTKSYTASALSETAEASNSADIIISLLAPLDNDNRKATLRMQVMKNRDGERASAIEVIVDYATSRFTSDLQRTPESFDAMVSVGGGFGGVGMYGR